MKRWGFQNDNKNDNNNTRKSPREDHVPHGQIPNFKKWPQSSSNIKESQELKKYDQESD